MGTPKTFPKRMPGQDRVNWVLAFLPCGERKKTEEEQHTSWECRWKICSSDFESWVRQVAPTATNLSSQNPWACGSGRRKQFTRSLLSSQRNSLGKLQQMGVMGEALQICGKGERLDRSASYRGTTSLFNVLGSGRVRDRSTQVYRKSTRGRSPNFWNFVRGS